MAVHFSGTDLAYKLEQQNGQWKKAAKNKQPPPPQKKTMNNKYLRRIRLSIALQEKTQAFLTVSTLAVSRHCHNFPAKE